MIIADDAVLVRQGVVRLLEDEGFEVIDQLTPEEIRLDITTRPRT